MTFIATKDSGRLHVGIYAEKTPTYQLGSSINAYNNFLTQFFAHILGLSVDVKIAGKMRTVNKKSFSKHLQSIGLDPNLVVHNYKRLFESPPTLENRKLLSDSLSQRKQDRLFALMIMAIKKNEIDILKDLVRKGAPIDRPFFRSEVKGYIKYDEASMRNYLLKEPLVLPYFNRYTPLSFAAEMNGTSDIAEFLLSLKKNNSDADTKTKYSVYEEKPLEVYSFNPSTGTLFKRNI